MPRAPGRVFVVGSTNVDRTVQVPRLPRPGETVLGDALVVSPGGKGANAAAAAVRAGATVMFVSAVGADGDGEAALAALRSEGVRRRRRGGPRRRPDGRGAHRDRCAGRQPDCRGGRRQHPPGPGVRETVTRRPWRGRRGAGQRRDPGRGDRGRAARRSGARGGGRARSRPRPALAARCRPDRRHPHPQRVRGDRADRMRGRGAGGGAAGGGDRASGRGDPRRRRVPGGRGRRDNALCGRAGRGDR